MSKKIITRFPPSPTGFLHIGGVRTALFNYLFAAHHGGEMILRFEDTDVERSKREYEEDIIASIHWLKLPYTSPAIARQSERGEIYQKYFNTLLEKGLAYEAEASKDDENKKVVRFKNPNKEIVFQDLVRGEVRFNTTDLGDFVIAKSITEPLYHLAVVIDDAEMEVTHIIRGEEHISNTPRQILILEALGFTRPTYAHLPLIVDDDRQKLSKRKHGAAVWLKTYKETGYLPEAMLNYLALLGWNPGTNQEIFTLEELVKIFDIDKVQKSSAVFDVKKLDWVNKQHIKLLPEEERLKLVAKEFDTTAKPVLDREKIAWKTSTPEEARKHLEAVLDLLEDKDVLMKYAEEAGKGNVLWPLRYALSGQEKSPDPLTLLSIIGVEESRKRVLNAIEALK